MNIVHIGLPKTGTTTLQNALFAKQDQFAYIGKEQNLYTDTLRDLINRISFQDSLDYDPAEVAALVATLHNGSKPLLVSDEIFSVEGRADRHLVAERLHRLFAPATVLIVVRNQAAMLQSMYLNHVRGSGQRIVSFATWLQQTYGGIRFPDIYRVALDYEPLVRTYEDVFGAGNVLVLPFELIREENSLFPTALAKLLHMPAAAVQAKLTKTVDNQRMSNRHLLALHVQERLLNGANLAMLGRRLLPQSVYQPIRRLVTGGRRVPSPVLPDEWRVRLPGLCARGNAQLEARKKIPLRQLGYPVEL